MRSDPELDLFSQPATDGPVALTIDGLRPESVVTPSSPRAVAEVLAVAAADGLTVAPVGGGTALALGNPPERLDLALSTEGLAGIIAYEPTDLTLSVGAGARFAEVQAVLAEHGQGLPLDVAHPEAATIGGLIATALSGPRRLGSGTLRDLLIGISVAHPSGTITKAGGFVVKNVTGFDLPRVYHGSLGTLGVIVSANFKVLPLPRTETTLLARFETLDAALAAATSLLGSRLRPAALELLRADVGWAVALRLDGRAPVVAAHRAEVATHLAEPAETLEGADSANWWTDYIAQQAAALFGPNEVLVRLAVRPRQTPELVRGLARHLATAGDVHDFMLFASPGLGLVTSRIQLTGGAGSPARLAEMQSQWLALADYATILAAPAAWKANLDVWGFAPDTLDVMRSLKDQFDPDRVLNRGRFIGHI